MITDTGNHQTWVEQYWDAYEPRSVFTPGGFAGMGFGTCGVLGVKLARPDRPAVCVTSDGSFMMFPGSVATAVEHDIPAVWVIMNNYTIGVIRDLQRFYMDNREIGTSFMKHSTGEFWNPDFAAMAQAMGAGAISVDQPGDLGDAFDTALKAGGPFVVDVKVNRDTAVPLIGTWQFPPIVAGGADVRIEDAGHLSRQPPLLPVHRDRRAGAPQAGAPAERGQPGGRRRPDQGAERDREVDGGPRARRAPARDRRRRGLPVLVRPERAGVRDAAVPAPELPVVRRRRRIVDLPLNATEDRVSGSVDVARALKEGEQALEPGLLAEANRGILYVDEINLLDDHLTDVLLDAAALGVNVVEREGVSVSHPARFLLVGTMNEEEGELRPQIADRIGLEVEVEALADPAARAEVDPAAGGVRAPTRRRSAPSGRTRRRSSPRRLAAAEERLATVRVPDGSTARSAQVVVRLGRREPPRRHRDRRVRARRSPRWTAATR